MTIKHLTHEEIKHLIARSHKVPVDQVNLWVSIGPTKSVQADINLPTNKYFVTTTDNASQEWWIHTFPLIRERDDSAAFTTTKPVEGMTTYLLDTTEDLKYYAQPSGVFITNRDEIPLELHPDPQEKLTKWLQDGGDASGLL